MSETPANFNWVKAHMECSAAQVFNELFIGAEQDVKTRNLAENNPAHIARKFGIRANTDGDYFAVFELGNVATAVAFQREQDQITVTSGDRRICITLGLNNDGKCRLKIDEDHTELEQWQIRKLLLEKLFFGSST